MENVQQAKKKKPPRFATMAALLAAHGIEDTFEGPHGNTEKAGDYLRRTVRDAYIAHRWGKRDVAPSKQARKKEQRRKRLVIQKALQTCQLHKRLNWSDCSVMARTLRYLGKVWEEQNRLTLKVSDPLLGDRNKEPGTSAQGEETVELLISTMSHGSMLFLRTINVPVAQAVHKPALLQFLREERSFVDYGLDLDDDAPLFHLTRGIPTFIFSADQLRAAMFLGNSELPETRPVKSACLLFLTPDYCVEKAQMELLSPLVDSCWSTTLPSPHVCSTYCTKSAQRRAYEEGKVNGEVWEPKRLEEWLRLRWEMQRVEVKSQQDELLRVMKKRSDKERDMRRQRRNEEKVTRESECREEAGGKVGGSGRGPGNREKEERQACFFDIGRGVVLIM